MTATIQLVASNYTSYLLRQTPGSGGIWKDVKFVASTDDACAHWLVVYDSQGQLKRTRVPKERRILFITEPPDIRTYHSHFVNQFGIAVSPFRLRGFKGIWVQRHSALPWLIAGSYDELISAEVPVKRAGISVICSAARKFDGQRRRFAFVSKLKELLQDRLHWYGRGVNEISNKADAIIPFRFGIAIENNSVQGFFTEKISDLYLGYAFPFYTYGKNLHQYFNKGSFEYLDLDDPIGAAEKIELALEANLYEERLPLLKEARRKVLDEYNLFNEVWKIVHEFGPSYREVPALSKPKRLLSRKEGVRSWVLEQPRKLHRSFVRLQHGY